MPNIFLIAAFVVQAKRIFLDYAFIRKINRHKEVQLFANQNGCFKAYDWVEDIEPLIWGNY